MHAGVKFTMVSDCCQSGSMLDHPQQQIYGDYKPDVADAGFLASFFRGATVRPFAPMFARVQKAWISFSCHRDVCFQDCVAVCSPGVYAGSVYARTPSLLLSIMHHRHLAHSGSDATVACRMPVPTETRHEVGAVQSQARTLPVQWSDACQ